MFRRLHGLGPQGVLIRAFTPLSCERRVKPFGMCQVQHQGCHNAQPTADLAVYIRRVSWHSHAAVRCADFLFPESVAYASGNLQEGTITPRCTTEDSRQVGCPAQGSCS